MSVSAVSRETPTGRLFLAPIWVYQRLISPLLPARCRYYPTCSSYAVEAIRTLGPIRGTIVAAWRIARCNPWSDGGLDPLSARTLFRDHDCGHEHTPHTRNGVSA